MLSIDDPQLWLKATNPKTIHIDGSLKFMVLPITAKMNAIVRTKEELFEDTVKSAYAKSSFVCAINAMQYGLSYAGKADALVGSDPVLAEHTTADGYVVQSGVITGRSAPQMFYIADDGRNGYKFGYGDPPMSAKCGIGGIGPIIINGLPYGVGNICPAPPGCPTEGSVSKAQRAVMTQRNNKTYISQQGKPLPVGKAIIATNSKAGKLMVIIQPNGATGISFDAIKAKLIKQGCDNAVFLDGSDSAMLFANGAFHIRQGSNKNETNTIGISFSL